ncbi:hypothetical protein [Nitratireductor sp. GCM10026969]|uniref:hypothetical protein n=1 Tax=Nitratireductor sp. GCM10026969 TaxID=3252645 RepID=UPI003609CBF0
MRVGTKRLEILHIRHHSLFVPRDFDLLPCFEIVKPGLTSDFDYKSLLWTDKLKAEKHPVPAAKPEKSEVEEEEYAMVIGP